MLNEKELDKLFFCIFIISVFILVEIQFALACQMPKKIDKIINLKGNVYDKLYKPYGQVLFNKNQVYIFGTRLMQNKNYEIVAIQNKTIICIKKVESFGSLFEYCDNEFCGYFNYCGSVNKNLKNAQYYLYNFEDVDCKNHKILKNKKPILQ
jgi:hypothetical protein